MSGNNSNSLTSIKDLKPGMNGINLQIIVLEIPRPTTTKDNQVDKCFNLFRDSFSTHKYVLGSKDSEGC